MVLDGKDEGILGSVECVGFDGVLKNFFEVLLEI